MIHFPKDGEFRKVGLNLSPIRGGFAASWMWYDSPSYELRGWRLRFSLHIKPRILWEAKRCNVIEGYLFARGLELVSHEVLQDLRAVENAQKKINHPL